MNQIRVPTMTKRQPSKARVHDGRFAPRVIAKALVGRTSALHVWTIDIGDGRGAVAQREAARLAVARERRRRIPSSSAKEAGQPRIHGA